VKAGTFPYFCLISEKGWRRGTISERPRGWSVTRVGRSKASWSLANGSNQERILRSHRNRFTIRSMKLESQRYGSLVESYHGNIRDRAGQKSKVKKERLVVNITVTNRELPGSRDDRCVTATLWSTSIFLRLISTYGLYKELDGKVVYVSSYKKKS